MKVRTKKSDSSNSKSKNDTFRKFSRKSSEINNKIKPYSNNSSENKQKNDQKRKNFSDFSEKNSNEKNNHQNSTECIRLNKYIAESGLVSRRKADELIANGFVRVNKKIVTELGTVVHLSDFITVKGDPINISHRNIYILFNKPKNCITSTNDEFGRQTVLDIVKLAERIFPVGRLDRNTTGVLLLTNDGELANCLTHPRYQVQRTYNVKLDKVLRAADAEKIAQGVDLEDDFGTVTAPCEVFIHPNEKSKATITLTEGKNHEVKKIFEAVGYKVKSLDRKYYHNLSTKGLARGKYRFLEKSEINELRKLMKKQLAKKE